MTVLAFMRPETARVVVLTALGVGYLGYHAVHWWRSFRAKRKKTASAGAKPLEANGLAVEPAADGPIASRPAKSSVAEPSVSSAPISVPSKPIPQVPPADLALTAEDLYLQARAIPHLPVPNFDHDERYLELLGQSSAKGYAPASAKLGEYAMRRNALVEAYYWMTLARRQGMHNLSAVLRDIRKNWAQSGFPDELENANRLFTPEAGSVGRAFLHIDSGQGAAKAREYLQSHHPEFIPPDYRT